MLIMAKRIFIFLISLFIKYLMEVKKMKKCFKIYLVILCLAGIAYCELILAGFGDSVGRQSEELVTAILIVDSGGGKQTYWRFYGKWPEGFDRGKYRHGLEFKMRSWSFEVQGAAVSQIG